MVVEQKQGAKVILSEPLYPNAPQVALYFDIIQEHSINLQSQITDNWLENNTVVNDHIANSPLTITLRGLAGEVVFEQSSWVKNISNKFNQTIGANASNKLGAITSLLPPVDNITQLAKNAVNYVEASYKKYEGVVKRFRNQIDGQTKLQKIFLDLIKIRDSKEALSVETPFSSFESMYIQTITLRQDNQNHIADIEVTLKQLNFTQSQTTQLNQKNREECNFIQRSDVLNHGYVQGNNQ